MQVLLTAEEMREIERDAINSGKVTGLELMERAGAGAVEAILAEFGDLRDGTHVAMVLCGPGNNGGDGFVVARLLRERGWLVQVFLYGDAPAEGSDAAVMQGRWEQYGPVRLIEDPYGPDNDQIRYDLLVDAVFGIGLTRRLEGYALLDFAPPHLLFGFGHRPQHGDTRVVSLDLPSGICSDSGRSLDEDGMIADLTVAFHAPKRGHVLSDGPDRCGRLRVVDIGLSDSLLVPSSWFFEEKPSHGSTMFIDIGDDGFARDMAIVRAVEAPEWLMKTGGHKYDHGHALILSGDVGRGGAARMAARGALRIGAGLVTLGCPGSAIAENAAQLNAIMLRTLDDGDALSAVLQDRRINALALGPGLGTGQREIGLLRAAMTSTIPEKDDRRGAASKTAALVLDADALTLIAQNDGLRELVHENCVLTPHAGEFTRLFPKIAAKLNEAPETGPAYSEVDAAREAAAQIGATILLKGPATVIAKPDGRAAINAAVYERSVPWLATAGAGDVLTGFIAGLLARGFRPFDAACTGAWLHTECALQFGPGLIAEDLPEALPGVLRTL